MRFYFGSGSVLGTSPVEQPDLLGAGQSITEGFCFLDGNVGKLIPSPGELPFFLPSSSDGLAEDFRPNVGMDAESNMWRVIFPASSPSHFQHFFDWFEKIMRHISYYTLTLALMLLTDANDIFAKKVANHIQHSTVIFHYRPLWGVMR